MVVVTGEEEGGGEMTAVMLAEMLKALRMEVRPGVHKVVLVLAMIVVAGVGSLEGHTLCFILMPFPEPHEVPLLGLLSIHIYMLILFSLYIGAYRHTYTCYF